MSKKVVLILSLSFVFLSCQTTRPKEVLSPRKMEQFLYDYHKAQSMSADYTTVERYKRLLMNNYLFDKYGITEQQFEESLVWYTRNPKELARVYEKIEEMARKEKNVVSNRLAIVENKSFNTLSGDTVDLWYLRKIQMLSNAVKSDRLLFEIPADTTFYLDDIFTWRFDCSFVGKATDSIAPYAYLSLSLQYGSDSIKTNDYMVKESMADSIVIKADHSLKLQRITGSINYLDMGQNDSICLLVSGLELQRIHD